MLLARGGCAAARCRGARARCALAVRRFGG